VMVTIKSLCELMAHVLSVLPPEVNWKYLLSDEVN
jgi:hypothetical protein